MEKNILNKKLLNNVLNYSSEEDEYLLKSENNRLTTFPIKNQEIWKSYELQQAMFWTAKEIDFSKDYNDFVKLCDLNDECGFDESNYFNFFLINKLNFISKLILKIIEKFNEEIKTIIVNNLETVLRNIITSIS